MVFVCTRRQRIPKQVRNSNTIKEIYDAIAVGIKHIIVSILFIGIFGAVGLVFAQNILTF